uniref:Retrovirus-related Pol polyprotein from transposon TNT 1-94 n=1 Tax=Cajanus cajan TaxID=3821 RepID=A0A151RS60_CAJCA|nr:Retrovirus-related Pol polyprotein from transposon TNT 1-94 [Cajanus cajan]
MLLQCGYSQASSDHSLFVKSTHDSFTVLLVYVDDVVLAGNSLHEFTSIKSALHKAFGIKDLGILKFFLGLEVAHSARGISLCQSQYCLDLLSDCEVLGCKPVNTPLEPGIHLYQDEGPAYLDIPGYRRLIGRLLYLTTTRPDICFATQQLSQFLANPRIQHYKAAQRVLRYLKGCPGKAIFFSRSSSLQLMDFSDADWGGCPDTRRSVSGYCFFLGHSLISWRSKKQLTVARSSSEAEYRALASASCELQWLSYLLFDLHVTCSKAAVLYCDNQSALHIVANPVFHERTKHLEIDWHVVRERCNSGLMKLLPIASIEQVANIFTKALLPRLFHTFLSKLSLIDIYQPSACGGCYQLNNYVLIIRWLFFC